MSHQPVLDKVVFPHALILGKIKEYANFLNTTYSGKKLFIITVLNGAAFFAVHLISSLTLEVEIDFIAVSSYQANFKKKAKFYKEIKINVTNQHLLIVEDIVDSGETLQRVADFAQTLKPKSVRFCSLVKGAKIKQALLPTPIDFLLTLPTDVWIVGFGIDFEEKFRNLKDIYSLRWSTSKKPIKTK